MMGFSIIQQLLTPYRAIVSRTTSFRHYSDDLSKLSAPHKVDNLEKRFLVWTGKYKSIKEVPAFVGQDVMERTRNRMRIKIANYMMAATVLGCIAMIILGKKDAREGKSLQSQNLEWHRQIKEDHEKEIAAAAAAQKK